MFDLGGGTFDVSVLEVAEGVFRVISTNGDTHLGGDDFDHVLINYVADEFKKEQGIDLRKDTMALQRLQEACEKAKKELSSASSTDINLPFITADASGPKHLQMNITRAKFEQLVDHLIERCRGPVMQALKDAKLQPKDIDEVVLVGGSTRIPKVQELVKKIFGKEPHKGVNPDEVVAVGAAIQGGVLAGEVQDVLLLGRDAAVAGHRDPGRHHDQARRAEHHHSHRAEANLQHGRRQSDGRDGQRVPGRAADGGATTACWASSTWKGIPPAPRGVPQIEVKFDIDANGILTSRPRIWHRQGADRADRAVERPVEEEIERMPQGRRGARRRGQAEARTGRTAQPGRVDVLPAGKADEGARGQAADADEVRSKRRCKKVREVAKSDNVDAIKSAIDELEQASHAFSKTLYEAGAKAAGPCPAGQARAATAPASRREEEAIDAEFEVKE